MIAEYPLITLFIIYIGLYYVSIKRVIKTKTFTKKKKYILISIVVFIPIIGVFVPLFMSVEEDNNLEVDYSISNSDKVEIFDASTSMDSD